MSIPVLTKIEGARNGCNVRKLKGREMDLMRKNKMGAKMRGARNKGAKIE